VKLHKGGELLPQLDVDHIFGGGDVDLIRAVRKKAYGYYRAGSLPSLLARHRVGLVVVPSIVPESFGLVISEAWVAGAAVVAFDIGAQGERIREQGGGWVVPLESGVDGLNDVIARWRRGEITARIPQRVATPRDAALAHIVFYSDAAAR
jgi:glycosyltransferase involved in cell wall biosynthesis